MMVMEGVLCCEFENQLTRSRWLAESGDTQTVRLRSTAVAPALARIAVAAEAARRLGVCLCMSI
ncbi:hypothetical protein CO667_16895 [Rhizobium sp. L43]|nr:hypothetical protein CO667_16895 [Rhizobium sp. L43]